jgi:hypothetical protein
MSPQTCQEERQCLLICSPRWRWVVSVTPRPRFAPRKGPPVTIVQEVGLGPRAGLDTEVRGEILCPCRGSKPDRPVVQSVVRHYTDWATRLSYFTRLPSLNSYPLRRYIAEGPHLHSRRRENLKSHRNCLFSTFYVEKLTTLLSFSDVNKERNKTHKWKELNNRWHFKANYIIRDMGITKMPREPNPSRPQFRQTHYQRNYRGQRKFA